MIVAKRRPEACCEYTTPEGRNAAGEDCPRLRVLYHYPLSHLDTGSPRSLLNLIRIARKRAAVEPFFLPSEPGPLVERLRQDGVVIVQEESVRSLSYRRPLASVAAVLRQVHVLRKLKVDLVHMNQPGWNDDLLYAARLTGVPTILHLRNADPVHPRNLNYRLASRLLVNSKALGESIDGLKAFGGKTEVLYNFTDVDRYASGESIREALGIGRDRFVICTVAQIARRKGIDVVLDVAEALLPEHPELIFLLVGPDGRGESDYAESVRARARQGPHTEQIRFLGSRDDVADVLASSDLFLLPSRYEPFGVVVIEAMAAGLPVVVSDQGGLTEVVDDPRIGTVVRDFKGASFTQAVRSLVEADPGQRAKMGRRARDSLKGRFDEGTFGRRLRRLYSELTGADRREE